MQATAAAHGYWIRGVAQRGLPPSDFLNLVVQLTTHLHPTRTCSLFQEDRIAPEISLIPVTTSGEITTAMFIMPTQADPPHLRWNETDTHPQPIIHGITRSLECAASDIDRAAAIAFFVTTDTIFIATRRDDALWWALRGRNAAAAEDGRPHA